jgi:pilus assembly protein CpaB
MDRKRLFIVGIIALFLAAFTSVGIYRVLRRAQLSQAEQISVVVAAQQLSAGVPLGQNMLRTVHVNKSAVPQGAFARIDQVKDRGLLVPVAKNEIITEIKLAPKEAGAGLPSMIPEGMRAVSVKVNEVVSVAGFVQPGTHVDVILTGQPGIRGGSSETTTTTVLQDVKVLAAGSQLQQNAKGEAQNVPVITLLVHPDEAQKLTLAANQGKIQLSLRNPLDRTKEQPPAIRTDLLYPQTHAPRPAAMHFAAMQANSATPAPVMPPKTTVEVIRDVKREQASF